MKVSVTMYLFCLFSKELFQDGNYFTQTEEVDSRNGFGLAETDCHGREVGGEMKKQTKKRKK